MFYRDKNFMLCYNNTKEILKGDIMENENKPKPYKRYAYKANVTLTVKEGEILKQIIDDNGCENVSQLCKKIVYGELKLH